MDQVDGGIIFIAFCRHQKDRKASELFGIASLGFTVNFVKVDLEIDSLSSPILELYSSFLCVFMSAINIITFMGVIIHSHKTKTKGKFSFADAGMVTIKYPSRNSR